MARFRNCSVVNFDQIGKYGRLSWRPRHGESDQWPVLIPRVGLNLLAAGRTYYRLGIIGLSYRKAARLGIVSSLGALLRFSGLF
jgi:hypothetical protein